MLDDLKNFDVHRMNLPELVSLSAYGRGLTAEFTALSIEAPEWVDENLKSIRREIKSRNADALSAKLREAKSRFETLKTPDEKRASLTDEIAKLEQQLQGA